MTKSQKSGLRLQKKENNEKKLVTIQRVDKQVQNRSFRIFHQHRKGVTGACELYIKVQTGL